MQVPTQTEFKEVFGVDIGTGDGLELSTVYEKLDGIATRHPMALITPTLSPGDTEHPIYSTTFTVPADTREQWAKTNRQIMTKFKLDKMCPVACGVVIAESADFRALVGQTRTVATNQAEAIVYWYQGALHASHIERATDSTEHTTPLGNAICKGEVPEKVTPYVLFKKVVMPKEPTRKEARKETVDWSDSTAAYNALHAHFPDRVPPGMRHNVGDPTPTGAALEQWWAKFYDYTKQQDLEWLKANEQELLCAWDMTLAPQDCVPRTTLTPAQLDELSEKNLAHLAECMGWVPSRTGVGVWRVMMYNFEKNKIISGDAATQCGQLSKTMRDSIRSGGYPTRLPRPLPKPVEK